MMQINVSIFHNKGNNTETKEKPNYKEIIECIKKKISFFEKVNSL